MSRETQHAVLLLLGGALLRITLDDVYLRYVRPIQYWPLLAAGAVMVVLALTAMISDRAAAPRASGEHDHSGVAMHVPWLLLVPVLVIALVPPPPLGADAVTRVGVPTAAPQDVDVFDPLPPGPAPNLTIAEFVQRAAWDRSGSLDGREVTLTGFVLHRDTGTELARLRIFCCAADARVGRVRMIGNVGAVADLAAGTWLRVRGVVQPGTATAASRYVPSMTVSAVEPASAPTDPYEY